MRMLWQRSLVMAKYRLLAEHVSQDGRVLPPGTLVGDGTPEPWPLDPSTQMEPLDEEGEKKVKEQFEKVGDADGWKRFEEDMRRRHEGETSAPAPQPQVAAPRPTARPAKPNEEQYPKG